MKTLGPAVAEWLEEHCTLDGSNAGDPLVLLDYQRTVLNDMFICDDEGTPLRTSYYLSVPRKNSKTFLAACLAVWYGAASPWDKQGHIVLAANSKSQADDLVFGMARGIIERDPTGYLQEVCDLERKDEVIFKETGSRMFTVAATGRAATGLSPNFVVGDEIWGWKPREGRILMDNLVTGSGARRAPMKLWITTAGDSMLDLSGQLFERGLKGRHLFNGEIVEGPMAHDPESLSFGMAHWGLPVGKEDEYDHTDPEVWEMVNPAWEIMNHSEMKDTCRDQPKPSFQKYRLNAWVRAEGAWIPTGAYEACAVDEPIPHGAKVVLSGDFSVSRDASAVVITDLESKTQQLIGYWQNPDPKRVGWVVPMDDVIETIKEAAETYDVVEMAFDPAYFRQEMEDLSDMGYLVVPYPATSPKVMTEACGTFYEAIMAEPPKIGHYDGAKLCEHVANCETRSTEWGVRIAKRHKSDTTRFIDAAFAAVIGYHRACLIKVADPGEFFSFLE